MQDASASCCGGGACGPNRREFLKGVGVTVASASMGAGGLPLLAAGRADAEAASVRIEHYVPADKRLDPAWIRSLYERGAPRVLRDRELNFIGMPVGGIAAGQLYLCGDGTLGGWQIFNQRYFSGYGADNYRPRMPSRPVAQGFAIAVEREGRLEARRLNRQDFPGVEFVGEYPLAWVRYGDPDFPVHVEMEAFSPFIPLNAADSALPATIFHLTVENHSAAPLRVALAGWLENAICFHSAATIKLGLRRTRFSTVGRRTLLVHTVEPPAPEPTPRPPIVLADFEGGSYGDWRVEGPAPGSQPASGKLGNQNEVTGFQGSGLVNTYQPDDDGRGRLTSPSFAIERKYVNFLIGGGKHPKEACINLIVDGAVKRTATGRNEERLLWDSWDVAELEGQQARIEIVDERGGAWGHISVDQIELADEPRYGVTGRIEDLEDFGSMALALDGPAGSSQQMSDVLAALGEWEEVLATEGEPAQPLSTKLLGAIGAPLVELAAGERCTHTFVLAWHFATIENGHAYAKRFADAAQVAEYVLDNCERLRRDTRLWHETYYDSTLPHWLLDRLHSTVCNLATGTCRWFGDGRFWAWEGVGCCEGTCTHVWNYAHALARLFPELERSTREMQDLGVALHDDGLVGFRGRQNKAYAADGQAGTVLKCYREHQMSTDSGFLERVWPRLKLAVEFLLKQDADDDGLIESTQHNTYDINFEGANTFVGSLYLAALRAAEEAAREVGEAEFADRCRRVFEAGSRGSVARLWNGQYFVQAVDLEKHPKDQYADGCLSDQLFGQGWAHQVGLGYIYPPEHVQTALRSIWRCNWAPDIGPQTAEHPPERWFATPGEAGLFVCTWPAGAYLHDGVRYREEVWTGCEYQLAGHMVWEGMLEEALAIVRAIHERYHPLKRNPFNEVECGDHYARALASWGVYLALCGYEYHGPRGHLGFAPRLTPEDFRAAFTAAEGWGTFEQRQRGSLQSARVTLRHGRLRLASLALAVPRDWNVQRVEVRKGGKAVAVQPSRDGERLLARFDAPLVIETGETLELSIS